MRTEPDRRTVLLRRGNVDLVLRGQSAGNNVGESEVRLIRIGFLGPGQSGTAAWGTAGLSPNCVLLFENQYARVYAIRVAAGGEQPQHCQRDCVVVCLSGAEMRCILPDGGSEVESLNTDQIAWRAAATQQRQNVGSAELWEIVVEPK